MNKIKYVKTQGKSLNFKIYIPKKHPLFFDGL